MSSIRYLSSHIVEYGAHNSVHTAGNLSGSHKLCVRVRACVSVAVPCSSRPLINRVADRQTALQLQLVEHTLTVCGVLVNKSAVNVTSLYSG
jgi:hypothetical protein